VVPPGSITGRFKGLTFVLSPITSLPPFFASLLVSPPWLLRQTFALRRFSPTLPHPRGLPLFASYLGFTLDFFPSLLLRRPRILSPPPLFGHSALNVFSPQPLTLTFLSSIFSHFPLPTPLPALLLFYPSAESFFTNFQFRLGNFIPPLCHIWVPSFDSWLSSSPNVQTPLPTLSPKPKNPKTALALPPPPSSTPAPKHSTTNST